MNAETLFSEQYTIFRLLALEEPFRVQCQKLAAEVADFPSAIIFPEQLMPEIEGARMAYVVEVNWDRPVLQKIHYDAVAIKDGPHETRDASIDDLRKVRAYDTLAFTLKGEIHFSFHWIDLLYQRYSMFSKSCDGVGYRNLHLYEMESDPPRGARTSRC